MCIRIGDDHRHHQSDDQTSSVVGDLVTGGGISNPPEYQQTSMQQSQELAAADDDDDKITDFHGDQWTPWLGESASQDRQGGIALEVEADLEKYRRDEYLHWPRTRPEGHGRVCLGDVVNFPSGKSLPSSVGPNQSGWNGSMNHGMTAHTAMPLQYLYTQEMVPSYGDPSLLNSQLLPHMLRSVNQKPYAAGFCQQGWLHAADNSFGMLQSAATNFSPPHAFQYGMESSINYGNICQREREHDMLSMTNLSRVNNELYAAVVVDHPQNVDGTNTPLELSPSLVVADGIRRSNTFPRALFSERRGRHLHSLHDLSQISHKRKREEQSIKPLGLGANISGEARCHCKKSKCLKLYCECFAAGMFCGKSCSCGNCCNTEDFEDSVEIAREQIQSRNLHAFEPKLVDSVGTDNQKDKPIPTRHRKGCNCKKSTCVKRYCECYQSDVGCFEGCHCDGCKNPYGSKPAVVYRRATRHEEESQSLGGSKAVSRQNSATAVPRLLNPETRSVSDQMRSSSKVQRSSLFHMSTYDQDQSYLSANKNVALSSFLSASYPLVPKSKAPQRCDSDQQNETNSPFEAAKTSFSS